MRYVWIFQVCINLYKSVYVCSGLFRRMYAKAWKRERERSEKEFEKLDRYVQISICVCVCVEVCITPAKSVQICASMCKYV